MASPTPSKRRTDVVPRPEDDVFDDSNVDEPEVGKRGQSPTSKILDSYPDEEILDQYDYEDLRQQYELLLDELAKRDRLDIIKEKEFDDLYTLNGDLHRDVEQARAESLPAVKTQLSTLVKKVDSLSAVKTQLLTLPEKVDSLSAVKTQLSTLSEKVNSLIHKLDTMADAVTLLSDTVGALHATANIPDDVKGKGSANRTLRKALSAATLPTRASLAKVNLKHVKNASPYLVPGGASKSVGDLLGSPAMSTFSLHKQPTRTNSPVRAHSPNKGLGQQGTSPGKPSLTSQGSPTTPSSHRSGFGQLKSFV